MKTSDSLTMEFRGGPWVSVLPIAIFVILTVGLVIQGAPVTEGMIVAAMIGISVGMFFARDMAAYSEQIFALMANRVATVAVVCWLWAGAFSGILADSGLVEAIVWIGWKLNLTGAVFTVAVFVSAALFATSVGTGLGTIVGFTAVMYPAGVVLGCHPGALMGAILSGAAFGDNLAPISDTTIVSAATQETDVGGVVRSRLKYVLIASGLACLMFLIFGGGGGSMAEGEAERLLEETANLKGLPMLIPSVLVFVVALSGRHFLAALTVGVATAVVLGPLTGAFTLHQVFHVTAEGKVRGSVVDGAMSLVPISVLTLLLVTTIGIMKAGGFLDLFLAKLQTLIGNSVKKAELAIVALISFTNICVSVNTVAMITAGPLANVLRKKAGIHPYRSANLLDTVSCSFPYVLPYSTGVVSAVAIQQQVLERYDFVPVVQWAGFTPFYFYGLILFPLMVVAVLTGFGQKKG